MNPVGVIFGVSLALALIGGVTAAFAQETRAAVLGLAAAMLGIAGLCLALGNDFVAIAILFGLAIAVPVVLMLTLSLAPVPQPDVAEHVPAPVVVTLMASGFAALAWVLVRTAWLPAGGARENTIEWLGSRFLSDHLVTLDLLAAFLAVVAVSAIALLRGRARARG